jgi:hypothetical protein
MKYLILILPIPLLLACSFENKLLKEMNNVYQIDSTNFLKSDYVSRNRKFVLKDVGNKILREFDSLIIIESVVYLQDYYSCSVFSDSLEYHYYTRGLNTPKYIDINSNPTYRPILAFYIFDKIKKGELPDILKQGEKVHFTHPSSILITTIKKTKKSYSVKGYNIFEFVPKEKIEERNKMKKEIKQ